MTMLSRPPPFPSPFLSFPWVKSSPRIRHDTSLASLPGSNSQNRHWPLHFFVVVLQGMEQVLQNINRLNRNLESIIAVSSLSRLFISSQLTHINPLALPLHRSATNSAPSRRYGRNSRTSWAGTRKKRARVARNAMKGSTMRGTIIIMSILKQRVQERQLRQCTRTRVEIADLTLIWRSLHVSFCSWLRV